MRELDLSQIVLSGSPLSPAPLGALDRLVLMGQHEDVEGALRAVRKLPGTAGTTRPPSDRQRTGRYVARALARARAAARGASRTAARTAFTQACALLSFDAQQLKRTELRDLSALQRCKLHITLALATAQLTDAQWLVLEWPLSGLRGRERAGVRGRLLDVCTQRSLGLVISTNDPVDAGMIGGTATVLEKEQVADSGSFAAQLAAPRSNLAAGLSGVNVFSALARGGWISIGHSQVKARTELNGKLFVTIPTSAVRLADDEFSPHLSTEAVFEAVVVGMYDSGDRVRVTLSPTDPEAGLALSADLFDFSAAEAQRAETAGRPWGILQPGLGADVHTQRQRVGMGSHIFAEVDTSALLAYPVDAAPTALQ